MYTVIGDAVFVGNEFFTLSVIIEIEYSFSVHNLDRRHCDGVLTFLIMQLYNNYRN